MLLIYLLFHMYFMLNYPVNSIGLVPQSSGSLSLRMTLTKDRIIESIYNSTDLKRPQAAKSVETLLQTIKKTLENGEDVLISGFGKFVVKDKKERRGSN
jgi:hypothetical protein